jgi:predicted O-methyltransferase YrrM
MKNLIVKLLQFTKIDLILLNNRLQMLNSRHAEVSAIFAPILGEGKPNHRLLKLFSDLIIESEKVNMDFFKKRLNVPDYVYEFPGEHYRVLQAIVKLIDAKVIVEIGTFTGLSSVSFFQSLDKSRSLYTFDIVPFDQFNDTVFLKSDFVDYNFCQIIDDISDYNLMKKHQNIFCNADLIFCDAPKDGKFEKKVLQNLQKIGIKDGTIIFFDDIKQWNMLKIWSEVKMPKIDITPIGHFTGSGIIEWDSKIHCF